MLKEQRIPTHEHRDTARVEAYSDGVFAIAATLLILQIQLPRIDNADSLLAGLGEQWPSYLGYTISFVTISIIWINHHNFFRLVTHVDHTFLILNSLLLLAVTFINYPTEILAQSLKEPNSALLYGFGQNQNTAVIFYSATFVFVSLCFNVLWRYAISHQRLLDNHADPLVVKAIHVQYRFSPLYYVPCIIVGLVSVAGSLVVNALLAITFALVQPVEP